MSMSRAPSWRIRSTRVDSSKNKPRLIESLALPQRAPVCAHGFGTEIKPQHVARLRVESGIRYRAFPVADLRDHGRRTHQVRFVGGRPLRNGPERVHQTPWTVGELVRKPPLILAE